MTLFVFTDLRFSEFKYFVGAGGLILFSLGEKLRQSDIPATMFSISGKVSKMVKVLLLVPLLLPPLLGKVLKLVELLQSLSFVSVLTGDLAVLLITHFCLIE